MLILRRRYGEALNIGDQETFNLRIRVLDHGGGEVRISIEAPDSVLVLREEIDTRVMAIHGSDEFGS